EKQVNNLFSQGAEFDFNGFEEVLGCCDANLVTQAVTGHEWDGDETPVFVDQFLNPLKVGIAAASSPLVARRESANHDGDGVVNGLGGHGLEDSFLLRDVHLLL